MRSLALTPKQKIFAPCVVAMPAAQPDHLCIVLYHNVVGQRKTPDVDGWRRHDLGGRRVAAVPNAAY
jgi:hypothetical protein